MRYRSASSSLILQLLADGGDDGKRFAHKTVDGFPKRQHLRAVDIGSPLGGVDDRAAVNGDVPDVGQPKHVPGAVGRHPLAVIALHREGVGLVGLNAVLVFAPGGRL